MILIKSWPPKINAIYFPVTILIIIIIVIKTINFLVPQYYDYNQVPTKVYCDKDSTEDLRYLLFPMTTIILDGGIGNQLFEVFSLLGIARTLNRTAIFNSDDWYLHSNLDTLHSQVPRVAEQVISIPIEIIESTRYVNSPACCHFQMTPLLFCEQNKFLVIDGYYFQSFKYFSHMESAIRKWLKPPEKEIQRLEGLVEKENRLRFKHCVHIRQGDFLMDGQNSRTDRQFTINAIDYLYSLHPGLIYLFSNDPHWTQSRIANYLDYQRDIRVMDTPTDDAISDLYFSQIHCDSLLITAPSSTFGWWMGYLSKNMSNVYYRDIQEVDDLVRFQMIEEDFFPAEWKKLKMSRNGRITVT